MGDVQLPRVGAEQDVHAVHPQDLEGGAAHRGEDGLGVERLADALVEGGEGAGLLVVEPLRLQVPRALDGDADLAAHRLEEAQLGLVEGGPRRAPPRSGRPGSCRRTRGARWRARPAGRLVASPEARAIIGIRGHSVVLRAWPPWPGREDLPAEALAEPPGPGEVEVRSDNPRWAARRSFPSFSSSRKTQAVRSPRPDVSVSRVESRMTWTSSSPWRRVEMSARMASSRSRCSTASDPRQLLRHLRPS